MEFLKLNPNKTYTITPIKTKKEIYMEAYKKYYTGGEIVFPCVYCEEERIESRFDILDIREEYDIE